MTNQYHVEVIISDEVDDDGALSTKEQMQAIVIEAVVTSLVHEDIPPPSGLTVLITDDKRLRKFSRDYLNKDAPTDVLSFPVGDATPGVPDYLGDIAISLPAVIRQSVAAGHSDKAELQLLTIHAVLHLLGFDHIDEDEMERMWSVQGEVLSQLGSEINSKAIIY